VGDSSNDPLMLDGPSLMWALVATTCVPRAPIVATGETHPSLLEHHSSDGIIAADRLPIATKSYGLSVQMRIVVVLTLITLVTNILYSDQNELKTCNNLYNNIMCILVIQTYFFSYKLPPLDLNFCHHCAMFDHSSYLTYLFKYVKL
jgi:hypothetical protein